MRFIFIFFLVESCEEFYLDYTFYSYSISQNDSCNLDNERQDKSNRYFSQSEGDLIKIWSNCILNWLCEFLDSHFTLYFSTYSIYRMIDQRFSSRCFWLCDVFVTLSYNRRKISWNTFWAWLSLDAIWFFLIKTRWCVSTTRSTE